jgi:hypothetical protein
LLLTLLDSILSLVVALMGRLITSSAGSDTSSCAR